ncbi:MAG TPA: asparagine--tRNA ligase [Terriglobales bacterium]|nr:asparagine--tRNA ligase [Terriglobales bacterium]
MINARRARIKDLLEANPVGTTVAVWGWVRTIRTSPRAAFVDLNDGTALAPLQIVLDRARFDDAALKPITTGCCARVTGEIVASRGRGQAIELLAASFEVVGPADEAYPLQKKGHSFEFLREIAHLRARSNTFQAVFRMRSEVSYAMHEYFHEHGYVYVHPPLITRSDCEGAGQAFRVTALNLEELRRLGPELDESRDYFGRASFLSVSAQLEGESLALGLGEIYTFSPIFRADPSETSRHAAEFWMIEPEMAFYDFDDLLAMIEDFVRALARRVRERCAKEIEFLTRSVEPELPKRFEALIDRPFARIEYTEAIAEVEKQAKRFETPIHWGEDLASEHERYLSETLFAGPVFVTNYPKTIKPFYMRLNDDGKTVACLDLLTPGVGEILSGSQREERYDMLLRRIEEAGMPRADYEWYLETRRWGSAPHSGFGIGLERFLMYATGMKNIRDLLPFPRTRGSM